MRIMPMQSTVFGMMESMEMLTPRQCRAGRALAGWTQPDLAARAGVFPRTVIDFEKGSRKTSPETRKALAAALIAEGVALLDSEGVAINQRSRP